MNAKGEWSSGLSLFYYVLGTAYYAYHIAFAAGGLSFLISAVGFVNRPAPTWAWTLLGAAVAFSVTGVASWRRNVKARLLGRNPCLNVRAIDVVYSMIDERNCDYIREVDVKAVYPVDYYKAHFHWSGHGEVRVTPVAGVSEVKINVMERDFFDECFVTFDRKLRIGHEHKFSYAMAFRNGQQPARPFLAHHVDVNLKRMSLKVRFPTGYKLKSYRKQMLASRNSDLPLWEQIVDCNNNIQSEAVWEIKPQRGYYYRIWWEVGNGAA